MINKCLEITSKTYRDDLTYKCGNERFYFLREDDAIYIGFRGSDDLKDWIENVDIDEFHIQNLNLRVHSGFWLAMLECWSEVKKKLQENYSLGDKIVLTGHSRGSAMSLCLGVKLIEQGFDKADISFYGFATPRVIKKTSKERFKRIKFSIYLFEIEGDPIPKLPRKYMGYCTIYDKRKVKGVVWWRKVWGVRAYNHKLSQYIKKFKVKNKLQIDRYKTIRISRQGIRG